MTNIKIKIKMNWSKFKNRKLNEEIGKCLDELGLRKKLEELSFMTTTEYDPINKTTKIINQSTGKVISFEELISVIKQKTEIYKLAMDKAKENLKKKKRNWII